MRVQADLASSPKCKRSQMLARDPHGREAATHLQACGSLVWIVSHLHQASQGGARPSHALRANRLRLPQCKMHSAEHCASLFGHPCTGRPTSDLRNGPSPHRNTGTRNPNQSQELVSDVSAQSRTAGSRCHSPLLRLGQSTVYKISSGFWSNKNLKKLLSFISQF